MRFLIFLLFLSLANASPKTRNRIVGGSPTTIQEYPYVANMQYGWGAWWTQLCGGSLITNFHVLSAAHCYESVTPLLWRVILGSTMRSGEGGSEHYVSDIILHENYDEPVLDNDIAIIRLSNAAQFSNTVQVVSIAGLNYNLANGATVTALGWGHLESNGFSPEELHHVDMEVINQQLCAERYAYLKTQPQFSDWPDISPGMICAGALDIGGKDACQGDSGGPLVHNKDILVGITSWGFGCADAFYPGVSARVSHYANWIVANAN